jgi:hypothetical protein
MFASTSASGAPHAEQSSLTARHALVVEAISHVSRSSSLMHLANRFTLFAALGIVSVTAACGSDNSTGPGPGGGGPVPDTPASIALHFDTLYASAHASSVGDSNYNLRVQALSDIEIPAAFGVLPTTLTVTTASGTEEWKGFVFEEVSSDDTAATDSAYLILAYRDTAAHTMIAAGFLGNGSSLGASLITNDTVVAHATTNTGSASLVSVSGGCATPPAALTNPSIANASETTCAKATLNAALTLAFAPKTGVDASLLALSFPITSFAGERFQDPLTGSAQSRVLSLMLERLRTAH